MFTLWKFPIVGLLLCGIFTLAACRMPSTPQPAVTPAATQGIVVTQPGEVIDPEAPAANQEIYLPELGNAAESRPAGCEQHDAALSISADRLELRVGESLTVTLTLTNAGSCAMLGLPKYDLRTAAEGSPILFEPANPASVEHSLGLDPGVSDSASFTLRAVTPGEAAMSGTASFEVHLGYPGPAYWANATSQPLIVVVNP